MVRVTRRRVGFDAGVDESCRVDEWIPPEEDDAVPPTGMYLLVTADGRDFGTAHPDDVVLDEGPGAI